MSLPVRRAPSALALTINLVALLVLAAVSLALRYAHLGDFGFLAALGIAVVKTILVAVFFMELAREKPSVHFAVVAGVALFALLLLLVVGDILTRAVPPMSNPPGTAQRYRG